MFTARSALFAVHCSLLTTPCSLFTFHCSLLSPVTEVNSSFLFKQCFFLGPLSIFSTISQLDLSVLLAPGSKDTFPVLLLDPCSFKTTYFLPLKHHVPRESLPREFFKEHAQFSWKDRFKENLFHCVANTMLKASLFCFIASTLVLFIKHKSAI